MLNDQTTFSHLGHLVLHSMVIDLDVAFHVVVYWCYRLPLSRTISIYQRSCCLHLLTQVRPNMGSEIFFMPSCSGSSTPRNFITPRGWIFFCSTNKLKISPRFLWICGQNSRTIDASLCIRRLNPFILFTLNPRKAAIIVFPLSYRLYTMRWYSCLENSEQKL